MTTDYTAVTEATGGLVSAEAWTMMSVRYEFVREVARGSTVLEVGCGSGQGIGYLRRHGLDVSACDISRRLLSAAHDYYGAAGKLANADAHFLPYAAASFDTVVLHEAIYYLRDVTGFIDEAQRVLKRGGRLVVCSANPERPDFNPSPWSVRYYSADEIRTLLEHAGFEVELRGGFEVVARTLKSRAIYFARKAAVALHLIPKSMDGKVWLKRVIYGRLVPIEPEVPGDSGVTLTRLTAGPNPGFKVIYAVGTLDG